MFRRYLLRRLNAPGNGIVTDPIQITNAESSGLSRIEYRIGTTKGEDILEFGVGSWVGVSNTSFSATVGRLVGYGNELLKLGATYVVVGVYDRRIVCRNEPNFDLKFVKEVVEWLFPRLSMVERDGYSPIRMELPETIPLWFNKPDKPSLRSLYLANANQVLSSLCNTTVQIGVKPNPCTPTVPSKPLETILDWTGMLGLGVPSEALQRARSKLQRLGVRCYLEQQATTLTPLPNPTVVYELQVGTTVRQLPLWGKCTGTLALIKEMVDQIPCEVRSPTQPVYDLSDPS